VAEAVRRRGIHLVLRAHGARPLPQPRAGERPELRARARHHRRRRPVRCGLLRHHAEGGQADGPATARDAGSGLGNARSGRLHARGLPGHHRHLRGQVQQLLLRRKRGHPPAPDRRAGRVPDHGSQRKGLHRHARGAQAGPHRAGHQRAHRLLHVARGGGAGVPESRARPVRHGPRGWRVDHRAGEERLRVPGGRHAVGRRAHPLLRRRRRGHRVQRRRRHGAAQALRRCGGRRRHHLRRAARRRHQQRWRRQGQLYGTQRGGPGGRHRHGPGRRRRHARRNQLRGGPRHRHAARRPDRGRGPHPGLPARHGAHALLRARLGEVQSGPPGDRRRRHRPDQDGPVPAHAHARAHPALPARKPQDRLRAYPLRGEHRAARLDGA
jgi:hypothetical protein